MPTSEIKKAHQKEKVDAVKNNPADQYSLDQLLRLIRLERTNALNDKYKQTLTQLRMGQLKVGILSDMRRFINLSKDKDGKFNASNSEFQELIKKSKEKYDKINKELKKAGESKETIGTFGDLLEDIGIKEDKKSYNNEETKAVLDAIKVLTEQQSPLNEMYMQMVTRIESEIIETYELMMSANKPAHNAIVMMARAARGG